jgi:hypothetical protein
MRKGATPPAVVLTVRVNGPLVLIVGGETDQLASEGAPEHVTLTVPLKPAPALTCKLYVVAWPAVIVDDEEPPLAIFSAKPSQHASALNDSGLPVPSVPPITFS